LLCDNQGMPERLEVQRVVTVSAGEIFPVLTDLRRHVAIDSPRMLMVASGYLVSKVDDTLTGHMDREALNGYPMACTTSPSTEQSWKVP
jgi:hypothetical protein